MRNIYFFIFLCVSVGVYSQDTLSQSKFKAIYLQAEELITEENYLEAIKLYQQILVGNENNANLNFKIGYCYLNDKFNKTKSIIYLENAAKSISETYNYEDYKEKNAPTDTYFYLGNALQYKYDFEQALFYYEKFKALLTVEDVELNKKVEKSIEECNTGLQLIEYPVEMLVENLGEKINSKYDEHSPVISADESVLLYTSKRENATNNLKNADGQFLENVYQSNNTNENWESSSAAKNWTEGSSIFSVINENMATISLSVDGQTLYLYSDKNNDGNIYESKLVNEKWTEPTLLPEQINTKYKESHATISPEQDVLYFSSNRPGGFGGSDIYMCKKLPTGQWGTSQNLGAKINTEYDEESPCIQADGVTLFYSSKGKGTIGGYDIFFNTFEDGNWTETVNIGYPINTTGDDVFYVPTPDGKRAYYSSFNNESFGGSDIYLISIVNSKEKALTVYSGQILNCNGKTFTNAYITISDLQTNEEVGIYSPNATTGKFLFILKSGKKYKVNVQADDNLSYSEIVDVSTDSSYNKIKKAIVLKPVIFTGETETFYANFDLTSSKINASIQQKIDSIGNFIRKYPKFYIGISDKQNKTDKLYIDRKNALISKIKSILPQANVLDLTDIPECSNIVNLVVNDEKTNNNYEVAFNKNSSEITSEIQKEINEILNQIKQNPNSYIAILDGENNNNNLFTARKNAIISKIKSTNPQINVGDLKDAPKGSNIVNLVVNDEKTNNNYEVAFNKNSSEITSEIQKEINEILNQIKQNPNSYIAILDGENNNNNLFTARKNAIISKIKSTNPQINVGDLKDAPKGSNIVNLVVNENATTNTNIPNNTISLGDKLAINFILFDFDKFETNEYNNNLNLISSYLVKNNKIKIKITGYTDMQGSQEYNLILSKKRAMFVKNYLVKKGATENQIQVEYKGKENPISNNSTKKSRKYNRRVEFSIIENGGQQIEIIKPKIPNIYKLKWLWST